MRQLIDGSGLLAAVGPLLGRRRKSSEPYGLANFSAVIPNRIVNTYLLPQQSEYHREGTMILAGQLARVEERYEVGPHTVTHIQFVDGTVFFNQIIPILVVDEEGVVLNWQTVLNNATKTVEDCNIKTGVYTHKQEIPFWTTIPCSFYYNWPEDNANKLAMCHFTATVTTRRNMNLLFLDHTIDLVNCNMLGNAFSFFHSPRTYDAQSFPRI